MTTVGHVVPARLAACRQPGSRRGAGGGRGRAAVRVRPPALGSGRAGRRCYLLASLAALDRSDRRPGGHADRRPAAMVRDRGSRGAGESRAHRRRLRPVRLERDLAVEAALAEIEVAACPDRFAVRRRPRPGAQPAGRRLPGLHALFEGLARPWLAAALATPRNVSWHCVAVRDDWPAARLPEGMVLPSAGEEAARRHWRALGSTASDDYAGEARPSGPRRDLAHVGTPQVGRDPPAHDAGRPR